MKISKIKIYLISILFLTSCVNYKIEKSSNKIEKKFYSSSGFALIYNEDLFKQGLVNKRVKNDKIYIMHSFLKTNTPIKIINPITSKSITAKVNKRAKYPGIFNIVVSEKVAEILSLDYNNPYVEVNEIKKNQTFVAKKGKTYEEEKYVAIKVPVKKIEIDTLSSEQIDKKNKKDKEYKKQFFLILSDFYYKESAFDLKKELDLKIGTEVLRIKKINNKKYRLYAGPFENFNSLKSTYISLNKLGFTDLDIIKDLEKND
tara:strand:- start:998 stop:1774 length:777 start_codon:yes stop_codon:yes gene_type:complete